MNPGGPGADPTMDFVGRRRRVTESRLVKTVGEVNDFVAVVPRGVGATTPSMSCNDTAEVLAQRRRNINMAYAGYNDTALIEENVALGKALAANCNHMKKGYWKYAGTVSC